MIDPIVIHARVVRRHLAAEYSDRVSRLDFATRVKTGNEWKEVEFSLPMPTDRTLLLGEKVDVVLRPERADYGSDVLKTIPAGENI